MLSLALASRASMLEVIPSHVLCEHLFSIILRLRGEGMLFLLFAEKKELHRKSGQFCDDNDIVTKNALRVNTGIRDGY